MSKTDDRHEEAVNTETEVTAEQMSDQHGNLLSITTVTYGSTGAVKSNAADSTQQTDKLIFSGWLVDVYSTFSTKRYILPWTYELCCIGPGTNTQ